MSTKPTRAIPAALLALLFGSCASSGSGRQPPMPFHVAILPPVTQADEFAMPPETTFADLRLGFDAARLGTKIDTALRGRFEKVTLIAPPPVAAPATKPSDADWIAAAQKVGADLILVPHLVYDPRIQTSINDRFWLNLPLFALGGPFCWFVGDRDYVCNVTFDARIYDVATAAGGATKTLDQSAHVSHVPLAARDASLSFIDRASGVGPYMLSFVCPAGLISKESDAIPAELDSVVTDRLCTELNDALRDRNRELTEPQLVSFHPRNVHAKLEGGQRVLQGE